MSKLSNSYNKVKQSTFSLWLQQEYKDARLLHAALVMAVMGWFPLLWGYVSSVLIIYGIAKYKALFSYFSGLFRSANEFFEGTTFSFNFAVWMSHQINDSWLRTAKVVLSGYILVSSSMPWSLFMIYGIYRPQAETRQAVVAQIKAMGQFISGYFHSLSNVKKLFYTGLAISCTSGVLGALFIGSGLRALDAMTTVMMLGLTIAGGRLAMTDLARAISHPLPLLTQKMGLLLGMIGGNRLAHTIFSGTMSGSLGPTYGAVQSGGLFPSIFGMFFSTNPYGHSQFFLNNTLGGDLLRRASTGVGGLLGSIFFSYDVTTYGTFNGLLGPTSYQLFVFMAVGAGVGYLIDKAVTRVSEHFYADMSQVWENSPISPSHSKVVTCLKSTFNFGRAYRFPIFATLGITGVICALKMPLYMTWFLKTSSPVMAVAYIESVLLIPALLMTKLYRIVTRSRLAQKQPEPASEDNRPMLGGQKKEEAVTSIVAATPISGPVVIFSPVLSEEEREGELSVSPSVVRRIGEVSASFSNDEEQPGAANFVASPFSFVPRARVLILSSHLEQQRNLEREDSRRELPLLSRINSR